MDSLKHRDMAELADFRNALRRKPRMTYLFFELTDARDNYRLGKLERQSEKTDLLILDELSYVLENIRYLLSTIQQLAPNK